MAARSKVIPERFALTARIRSSDISYHIAQSREHEFSEILAFEMLATIETIHPKFKRHLGEDLQVGGGAVNGWDSTADWNSSRAGLVDNAWNRHVGAIGLLTWSGAATAGDSLAWFGIWSLEPDLPGTGRTSRYLQSLVYRNAVQFASLRNMPTRSFRVVSR